MSRPVPGEAPLAAFEGKVAGLLSASPGALVGVRGLAHVRAILQNIRVMVVPEQVTIPRAADAFAPDGRLKDGRQQHAVERLAARLVEILVKLGG